MSCKVIPAPLVFPVKTISLNSESEAIIAEVPPIKTRPAESMRSLSLPEVSILNVSTPATPSLKVEIPVANISPSLLKVIPLPTKTPALAVIIPIESTFVTSS